MELFGRLVVGTIVGLNVVVGFLGNLLVILAVVRERKLHTRANYLIGSLASADLLVSLLVLPFAAIMVLHENEDTWWLPERPVCRLFIFLDVTCCTASILHLCVIAWVRYRKVSTIRRNLYSNTFVSVIPTIVGVWAAAVLLSVAPYLMFPEHIVEEAPVETGNVSLSSLEGNSTVLYNSTTQKPSMEDRCIVNNNKVYRVVATTVAFYAPLVVILVIYSKMAKIAWARIHRNPSSTSLSSSSEKSEESDPKKNRSLQWVLKRIGSVFTCQTKTKSDKDRSDDDTDRSVRHIKKPIVILPTTKTSSESEHSKLHNGSNIAWGCDEGQGRGSQDNAKTGNGSLEGNLNTAPSDYVQEPGTKHPLGNGLATQDATPIISNKNSSFLTDLDSKNNRRIQIGSQHRRPCLRSCSIGSGEERHSRRDEVGSHFFETQKRYSQSNGNSNKGYDNSTGAVPTPFTSVRDILEDNHGSESDLERCKRSTRSVQIRRNGTAKQFDSRSISLSRSSFHRTSTRPDSLPVIYRRSQIRRKPGGSEIDRSPVSALAVMRYSSHGSDEAFIPDQSLLNVPEAVDISTTPPRSPNCRIPCAFPVRRILSLKMKRERKVIRTLGMVIGAFVICWLPFFAKEIILPFCTTCYLPRVAEIFINWLGYANSSLNPFIYSSTNKEFNMAFRNILTGKKQKYSTNLNPNPRASV